MNRRGFLGLIAKLVAVGHAIEFTIPLQVLDGEGLTTTTGLSVIFAREEVSYEEWTRVRQDFVDRKPEFALAE